MSKENNIFLFRIVKSFLYFSLLLVLFVLVRLFFVPNWRILFLVWNLLLAWIPLLISIWLYVSFKKNIYSQSIAIIAWLIFLPNAPYLLTDFFHFTAEYNLPLWYDLIMFSGLAFVGLCLGFVSIFLVEEFFKKITTPKVATTLIFIFIFLTSFGVYFGRYLRRNSWDVLSSPILVAGDLANAVLGRNSFQAMGMTGMLFLFLLFGYGLFRTLLGNKNKV